MDYVDIKPKDEPIFDDTSFSALLKDIYQNSTRKRQQIDILINELRPLIKQLSDAAMVVPLIKEYMEVGVKNDEQLVKLAGVYQKFLAADKKLGFGGAPAANGSSSTGILTEEEMRQIQAEVRSDSEQLVTGKQEVQADLDELMKKVDELKTESNQGEPITLKKEPSEETV